MMSMEVSSKQLDHTIEDFSAYIETIFRCGTGCFILPNNTNYIGKRRSIPNMKLFRDISENMFPYTRRACNNEF